MASTKIETAAYGAAAKISALYEKHDDKKEEKQKQKHKDAQTNGDHDGASLAPSGISKKEKGSKQKKKDDDDDDGPAGGYDDTSIPHAPTGYTVKFTFHRATNLPMADINSFSSDPYILATLTTGLPTRHKEDPPLVVRTPTKRRETEPVWDTEWIVANVPASGFRLKCRIYDEDPADHDDRLGNSTIVVHGIDDTWPGIQEQSYKIKKRMGSKRAYILRGVAVVLQRTKHMGGALFVSVEVLGKTKDSNGGRCYTVGPMWWTKHYSPMLGRLTGKKEASDNDAGEGSTKQAQRYNFQANQFQFHGPVPSELYHRFVEFKPFVKRMFTSSGVQGFLLSKALHHQHARVYNFDRTTEYGTFPDGPSEESTLKFLDLVHYDKGGRIFTYVLTLDALFRFTETGKEFGIDFLSKHTMHSDVNIYIAFSGEFFVRRLEHKNRPTPEEHLHNGGNSHLNEEVENSGPDQTKEHPPQGIEGGGPDGEPVKDVRYYELVIDNDSGTYRPNAKLLPKLKEYLQFTLPGLHIVTLDCQADAELQQKMKKEQREKKETEGDHIIYRQTSQGSSISSSDISDLDDMENVAGGGTQQHSSGGWESIGQDFKKKGKARGQKWKGVTKGREGLNPEEQGPGPVLDEHGEGAAATNGHEVRKPETNGHEIKHSEGEGLGSGHGEKAQVEGNSRFESVKTAAT